MKCQCIKCSRCWLKELPGSRGVRPTQINMLQSNITDVEELHRDRRSWVGGQLAAEVMPMLQMMFFVSCLICTWE